MLTVEPDRPSAIGGRLRPHIGIQLSAAVLLIVAAVGMVVSLTSQVDRGQVSGIAFGLIFVGVPLLVGTRIAYLPYLTWDQTEVTVANPFVTRAIPWADIERVLPGQLSLGFERRTGRNVWVWAIQRANASAARKSRVDRVAAMLEEFRVSATTNTTAATGTRKVQIPWPELAILLIYASILTWHIHG